MTPLPPKKNSTNFTGSCLVVWMESALPCRGFAWNDATTIRRYHHAVDAHALAPVSPPPFPVEG